MQAAVRTCLTAGVALVGVGVIAMAPVAPPMPDVEIPAMAASASGVHLAGTSGANKPGNAWLQVFEHVFQNVTQVGTSVAGEPVPELQQLIASQFDYAHGLADGTIGAGQAVGEWAAAVISTELQNITAAIDKGDYVAAAAAVNSALNGGIFVPLALEVLQIPVQITGHLANVVRAVVSLDTLLTLLVGAVGPIEAVLTAGIDSSQAILAGISAGDTDAALAALISTPGVLAGAFLNGYRNAAGDLYPGIFTVDMNNPSQGGLLQTLLVTLPRAIAVALGLKPTPVELESTKTVTAVPDSNAPSVTVKVTHAPASTGPKTEPTLEAADAPETAAPVTTKVAESADDTAVVKGGNKVGEGPKRATSKPSDGSTPGATKSTGSRSSAGNRSSASSGSDAGSDSE